MTQLVITENRHSFGFVVSEDQPGRRSRDEVTLAQQTYSDPPLASQAGTVLGKITTGAQTVAAAVAFAGNTGNGALGSLTGDAAAMAGDWKVVIDENATNAGAFEVFKPDGTLDGTGNVAVAYNGGINFTLADGATDFVAGDGFTINVSYAAGSGKYVPLDLSATDGSQNAVAILGNTIDASSGDTKVTVIVRAAEVNGGELIYPSGASANDIAAINAQLTALGIIVR